MAGYTPMMLQYLTIKENHKDHILFYRLGDFYEMFFDDAILASKELGLTLTGRDCGMSERAPMCGVPYHSAEGYIAKLIKKGYKVAICEQVEEADLAKGLVTREVVRVITPGTIMEDGLLDESKNNFLCSIYSSDDGYGLAFADISTGEINLLQTDNNQINVINELVRFAPKEIVFNPDFVDKKKITDFVKQKLKCTADLIEEIYFEYDYSKNKIIENFDVKSLNELNIEDGSIYVCALGGMLTYLEQTQKSSIKRLLTVNIQLPNKYMNLDHGATVDLELTQTLRTQDKRGSLLWVIDNTKTSMGKRLMRSYISHPLVSRIDIEKRLNSVEELFDNEFLSGELEDSLTKVHDIERLLTRVVYGSAGPREYKVLENTIKLFPQIKNQLSALKSENLRKVNENIDELDDLASFLEKAILPEPLAIIREGGVINDGFNEKLDEYRDLIANARLHLSSLEDKEKEKSGIKILKVGYNKIFGYYFEVTKSYQNLVPEYFIRKQTLANAERYITEELKDLESKILSAHDAALKIEQSLFQDVREKVVCEMNRIQNSASAIARLDVMLSFASVSRNNGYVMPKIEDNQRLEIIKGRHPVVEKVLQSALFVPNDTLLDTNENQIALITGPNMAGKSTYMRQIALIVLMAQIGCFVPAERATVGIVDGIYTRIGASDDLASGDSTFMIEMKEMAEILKSATSASILILDEIGRGTSTHDGMSIARAVTEYISDPKKIGAKTLFATHYHELIDMEGSVSGVKNYHIAAKKRGDDIVFLRRIVRGGTDESYGIEVSKLAGVPNWVINRSHEILNEIKNCKTNQSFSREKREPSSEERPITLMNSVQKSHPIFESLEKVDVEALTPIEALNFIHELKKEL